MFTKVLQHGEMDCDTFEGIKIVEKSAIEMKLLFITGFTRDCYQDLYSSDLHKKYKKWLYHDLNKEIITMSLLLGFYPTSCFPLQTENNFYYFIIIKDAHLCFFSFQNNFGVVIHGLFSFGKFPPPVHYLTVICPATIYFSETRMVDIVDVRGYRCAETCCEKKIEKSLCSSCAKPQCPIHVFPYKT